MPQDGVRTCRDIHQRSNSQGNRGFRDMCYGKSASQKGRLDEEKKDSLTLILGMVVIKEERVGLLLAFRHFTKLLQIFLIDFRLNNERNDEGLILVHFQKSKQWKREKLLCGDEVLIHTSNAVSYLRFSRFIVKGNDRGSPVEFLKPARRKTVTTTMTTTTTTAAIATAHDTFDSTICCRLDASDAWRRDAPPPLSMGWLRVRWWWCAPRRTFPSSKIERDPSKDEQRKLKVLATSSCKNVEENFSI